MKKTLIFFLLLCSSLATMATPDPKKKNLKKARVNGKNVLIPLPPKGRR